jgi:hypothetical protein
MNTGIYHACHFYVHWHAKPYTQISKMRVPHNNTISMRISPRCACRATALSDAHTFRINKKEYSVLRPASASRRYAHTKNIPGCARLVHPGDMHLLGIHGCILVCFANDHSIRLIVRPALLAPRSLSVVPRLAPLSPCNLAPL